ncbi:probable maltase [Artemia franciscana]|uniref:probable maltase n=1 Tax=Artemia franciscana TaxID=6661 RepID=UPI0032DB4D59
MLEDLKAPVATAEDDSLDTDDSKQVLGREPKVKYEPAKNGVTVVDIENSGSGFAGLGKEELMKIANQPFWVRLRWTLFILFWLSWIGMIAGAIGIIVITPKCSPRPVWQKYPVYQVFSKSYQDTDFTSRPNGQSSGIGDLEGIRQRIPYLVDLGVKTIGLSVIFPSPMKDVGYDISDFMQVGEEYGTLDEFDRMVKEAKERGLSVVLDFVPNHSSEDHEWFQKSINKTDPFTDYYIWNDGVDVDGQRTPPNNWECRYSAHNPSQIKSTENGDYEVEKEVDVATKTGECGSAWTWNEERQQYYFHQFAQEEPDLNLRNPAVVEEMKKVARFWLDRGIAGLRVNAAPFLFESEALENEIDLPNGQLSNNHTFNLPEVYAFLLQIREVLDDYSSKDGMERILMTEGYVDLDDLAKYYKNNGEMIAQMPMNLGFTEVTDSDMTGNKLQQFISAYLEKLLPESMWPNWVLGNHDRSRVATRVGENLSDSMNMIAMLLPGTPINYYGEEIGMEDSPDSKFIDRGNRNGFRTPMQWSNETNAGFSEVEPWLAVNGNYPNVNVAAQDAASESHLKVYRELVKIREMASAQYGEISFPYVDEEIFSFVRNKSGNPGLLVAVNLGDSNRFINFSGNGLPETLTLKLKNVGGTPDISVGSTVSSTNVTIPAKNGFVFSY